MRSASPRPVTILLQIWTAWCTKLRKHFDAVMEVFCCFYGAPLRSACLTMHPTTMKKMPAVATRMQNNVVVESEVTVRASSAVLAIWVAWSSCQKIKMMQCALFYCDLSKQKMSTSYLRFVNIATSPDRTEQIFPAGCFNFAQMKASVELCINKLSGGWCRWYIIELKVNCEVW